MENSRAKTIGTHVVKRQPHVLQCHAIRVGYSPVWIQDYDRLRNSIDHPAKLFFRLTDRVKGISERFLRPLAFDCDQREAPGRLDQSKVRIRRHARLGRINRKRPENLIVLRQNWLGPRRPYPVAQGNVAIFLRPVWLSADIWDNDTCLQKCSSSA